ASDPRGRPQAADSAGRDVGSVGGRLDGASSPHHGAASGSRCDRPGVGDDRDLRCPVLRSEPTHCRAGRTHRPGGEARGGGPDGRAPRRAAHAGGGRRRRGWCGRAYPVPACRSLRSQPDRSGGVRGDGGAAVRGRFGGELRAGAPSGARRPDGSAEVRMMETLLQDLRYAFRTLRKSPGFTVVAVLTLALGIGANTTIFSLVNGVMLRPLPFRDPGRLVRVWESSPPRNCTFYSTSQPDFLDYREQNHSFERLAATMGLPVTLTEGDAPERISGLAVSPNFFATLGITPLVGRDMLPEEGSAGRGSRIVLISHGLWQRRFGSRRDIIGSTISLDEQPYSVIGVVPTDVTWSATDVFVPLVLDRNRPRGDHRLTVIGRLKSGVTLAQAQFDLATIA